MADLGRILIVVDEDTLLHWTADLLRREGYECVCAPDAGTAAEMLRPDYVEGTIGSLP